jgi:GNAT superfamily N-acetyltransferase
VTIAVRRLEPADWPVVWPMLLDRGVNDQPPEVVRERYGLLLADERWLLLGVSADGALAGYAMAQDYGPTLRGGEDHRAARLHDVYVLPDRRRAGMGRALMAAVTDWAGQRVRYLEWQAHRDRAAPFYERLGYHGEPCPQPEYPTFEVDFRAR